MEKPDFAVSAILVATFVVFLGVRSRVSSPSNGTTSQSDDPKPVVAEGQKVTKTDAGHARGNVLTEPETNPQGLLAKFLLTGDPAFIDQARRMFPDDRLILLQSVMLADHPDSPELSLLEQKDPQNSLPNLIRAGLLAQRGNLVNFREEFELAISKKELDTGYRQRQALILDEIIAENSRDLDPSVYLGVDKDAFDCLGYVSRSLVSNPQLFGDEYESAGYAVAFAEKLRAMGGGRQAYVLAAGQLEIDVLNRLDPSDEYVEEGRTIGQRIAELEQQVPAIRQRMVKYLNPAMSPDGDPVLRMQFFARVRSVGEAEALGWLATKIDDR